MRRISHALFASALLGGFCHLAKAHAANPSTGNAADIFGSVSPGVFGARLGDLDGSTQLRLVLTLPLRNVAAAAAFVRAVSMPGSAIYGNYLTPLQFADRFGASAADYAALAAWARGNGLTTLRPSVARTSLTVSGDAATIGRLFSTRLARLQTGSGVPGFAPATMPVLPAALVGKVSGVIGLVDMKRVATLYRPQRTDISHAYARSGVFDGFSPSDLRMLYDVPAPLSAGLGQSVALFEQGGFTASDIDVYKKRYGVPSIPVVVKSVNGSGTGDVPGVDIECDIDIDMAIGINANLKQVFVYEDANDPFPVALVDALTDMADDNSAQTISISYGVDEALSASADEMGVEAVAMQMAAQGQTLFVSSGDNGAYGDEPPALNVSFPASDPYVTAVGGTTLFSLQGRYGGEEAWNLLGLGAGATGGGISTVFRIPGWQKQKGISVATANGGSASMRNVPDVAADGDPETGISIYSKLNGGWLIFGGTSVSAPIWAGFNSIVDGARAGAGLPPLGFFNPLLYRLGGKGAYGLQDVEDGSNGNADIYGTPGFNAGFGYDNTTGFGSVNLANFAYSVLTVARSSGTGPGKVENVAIRVGPDSVAVDWSRAANATGYLVTVRQADDGGPIMDAVTTTDRAVVGGLTNNTPYYVYVTALNAAGAAAGPAVFFSTKVR